MPKVHTRQEFTRRSFPEWVAFARRRDPDGRYPSARALPDGWGVVTAPTAGLAGYARLPTALLDVQTDINVGEWRVVAPLWLAPLIDGVPVHRDRAGELMAMFGPLGAPGRAALGAAYAVGGADAYRAAVVIAVPRPQEQLTLWLWPFRGP